MPRYFINIRDEGGDLAPDHDGALYADLDAAKRGDGGGLGNDG
jgi:hypothetical protein